ncbi:mutS-like 6 [Sarcoptes scabiei]|uniref:Uncharacterized protein n=1 Tax=Sarcoptes scabiei TaxID=52283 RepID=A0A132AET3_SARSC|nr:hypothetical protein QR98_0080350 [Sarcoptes scabiei]UXI21229.1 mutS-like 6 [Sarcoptes scabiei]
MLLVAPTVYFHDGVYCWCRPCYGRRCPHRWNNSPWLYQYRTHTPVVTTPRYTGVVHAPVGPAYIRPRTRRPLYHYCPR